METQTRVVNAAWPALMQHGEGKEQPSCLDTRHRDHTQLLDSLMLYAVDDWGPFPAWDFMCGAHSLYGNCWDFQKGVTRLQARKRTQRTVARNQAEAHENNKIDVQTGTSPGAVWCWQADPGCVASLSFTALDTQHQLSHMSGVTFPTVGMQPPLEQNPAAV